MSPRSVSSPCKEKCVAQQGEMEKAIRMFKKCDLAIGVECGMIKSD